MGNIVCVFDEMGHQYIIENLEGVLTMLPNDDIVTIYKCTKYFHNLNMTVKKLIELGKIEQVEGSEYNFQDVERALLILSECIKNKLGDEALNSFDELIDIEWETNKPNGF